MMNIVSKQKTPRATEHLTVVGERGGDYIIDEELPDGRLVIRADTSAAAMNRRMGTEPISTEEFEAFVAEHRDEMLPPDDEG
jgi:hypothetical protein